MTSFVSRHRLRLASPTLCLAGSPFHASLCRRRHECARNAIVPSFHRRCAWTVPERGLPVRDDKARVSGAIRVPAGKTGTRIVVVPHQMNFAVNWMRRG